MANRYTQIQNTPYVPTYQPMDFNQIGSLLGQAANFKMQEAQARAETDALMSSVAPDDPEGQEFMKAVTERQIENLGQSDEPLAQRAIRAKTAGIRTAGAINAYKKGKQQQADWVAQTREANPDVDPKDLEYLMSLEDTSMNYDLDNLSVQANVPGVKRYAPDINLSKRMDEYGSGIKSSILGFNAYDEDGKLKKDKDGNPIKEPFSRVWDESLGKYVTTTNEGVSTERVINAMDQAAKGDTEVQQYLGRRRKVYSAQAREIGAEDALAELVTNAPEESRDTVMSRVEGMRDKGLTDDQIYGELMATNELRSAQGFGASKYAFQEMNQKYVSPTKAALEQADEEFNESIIQNRAFGNPFVTSMPEEINFQDQESIDSLSNSLSRTYQETGTPTSGDKEILSKIAKLRSETPSDVNNLEDFFNSEYVNKTYGTALDQLREDIPKREGESNEDYIARLNSKYKGMREQLASTRHNSQELRGDAKKEARTRIIGTQGVNGDLGQILNLPIVEVDPETGEETVMRIEELADEMGLDMSDPDFRDKFVERLSIPAKFEGNDPSMSSGYYVNMTDLKDNWGPNNTNVVRTFKVPEPTIFEQSKYEQRRKLSELKFNPKKSSTSFEIGDVPIEAKAENVYVDAETGERVSPDTPGAIFKEREIILKDKNTGDEVREGTLEYNNIIGLTSN